MDDTDKKLLILLSASPRMPFTELAERLGLSKQAVHRRMQALMEVGIIEGITASISMQYLDAVRVMVFGKSKTTSVEKTLDRLGESEFSSIALAAGENLVYVVGELRDISELGRYVEFVRRAGEMPDPAVGIYCFDDGSSPGLPAQGGRTRQSYRELSPLDLRIIAALKDDARMSITDIACVVGVSARTVRRHLEDMLSEGSLDLRVPWDPSAGAGMFLTIHVTLKASSDKAEACRRLYSKFQAQPFFIRTFSNIPAFLWCVLSLSETGEVRRVLRMIAEDDDVLTAVPNFIYIERNFKTWRDRLPEAGTPGHRGSGVRSPRSRLGKR